MRARHEAEGEVPGLDARIRLTLGRLDLDATLGLPPGEVVALLGPNGAGKTTLLRALAGLVPLAEGHVHLDGTVLEDTASGRHVPTAERPIGYVFQDYLLFPHLNALENVAFGLRCRRRSRADARRAAAGWLERVGLADHAADRPGALSGGQAQRIALARALATEPRLLLLDEPLAALDAATRGEVRADLRRHLATFAGARLLVTHDPLEAMVLASRLVILEDGRVVQTGTPAEISHHPRSSYVARLVGLNLFRGRARGATIALDGGGELRAAVPDLGATSQRVFAAIRPRSVALYRSRPDGTPRNLWPGRIVALDIEGDRVRAQVDAPIPLVAEVTAAAVADLGLHDGADVWVSVKATDVDVYPD